MTTASENETLSILVDASIEDIEAALREELAADELSRLKIGMIPDPEEELLGSRRGGDDPNTLIAAVQFVGLAIAGGYTHDLFKAVLSILRRRLGKNRIFPPMRPEDEEET